METIKVTVSKEGVVKGAIDNIIFYALVFDEPSEFGIDGGRISKLFVYKEHVSPAAMIARYERGWEKPLTEDIKPVYDRIRKVLGSLPTSEAA